MKSGFKVIYDKGQMNIEGHGLPYFNVDAHKSPHSYAFDVDVLTDDDLRQSRMWLVNATIPDKAFVIERLPNRKLGDCYFDEISGLKPYSCFGKIRLRNLTNED